VTVTVNGVPFSVDGAGAFGGPLPLSEGTNILTTTAIDEGGNSVSDIRTVILDTTPPTLVVTEPQDGDTTSATTIDVSGTVTDASAITPTINGNPVTVGAGGAFSELLTLVDGPNPITVVATDAATNSTTEVLTVVKTSGQTLPPDPSTVAPPLDPSVATSVFGATEFLYTGPDPIQTGVGAGVINPLRAGLLRGTVLTRSGQPLTGVTVSIFDHPELGQTLSRADGMYDLVANGGGTLTLSYVKAGYLPVQRQVDLGWNEYGVLPDVVMIGLDPQVSTIDFSDPIQVARGSVETDSSGPRQATLMFEQGTQASMLMPDSSTQPLTSLSVRATEYTVGAPGPAAMPGDLPPTSGYTYAAELSADEAIAAGAVQVEFSQPVSFYVENFIGFAAGTAVPVGYYDRQQAEWIPIPDGRVIEILSITGGMADLDIDGSGLPADSAALAGLGVSDAERQSLATLYAVGQSLWRTEHTHFSPIDWNWPWGLSTDAIQPPYRSQYDDDSECPSSTGGSIIECENQVLGERIGATGTPFSLNYRSARVFGRTIQRRRTLFLSDSVIPPSLKRIDLDIRIAGRQFTQSFSPLPNQKYTFIWDGLDAFNRRLQGSQWFDARIGYVYDVQFQSPFVPFTLLAPSFGLVSGVPSSTVDSVRGEATLWQRHLTTLGSLAALQQGLGSWTIDVHHAYDPSARILHLGDGRRRGADKIVTSVRTAAGDGAWGFGGDGGPARSASLRSPTDVTVAPDGIFYIADRGNRRVRVVDTAGIITTVAGTGVWGFGGDGGPATQAELGLPVSVALGPDGSLYIADESTYRIRKVDTAGIISTFAGNGSSTHSGDGGLATQAGMVPLGVAAAADGSVYINDNRTRIRRIDPNGIIMTIAGTGTVGCSGDGGPASLAELGTASRLTTAPDGSVYVADNDPCSRVRRIDPNGIITTVAGNGQSVHGGDGGPATQAGLDFPTGVAIGPDGSLYISTQAGPNSGTVRRVGPDGIITTIAGGGTVWPAPLAEGGPALLAKFPNPQAVAIGPDGSLYIADDSDSRIREVPPVFPRTAVGNMIIPSEDGSVIYEFTASGRHLQTLDALTGATLLSFAYDTSGGLASITDADGNVTTITRDASGNPTGIVAPFGQQTTLTLDPNGYLASVANPLGETVYLFHGATGLLDSLVDPRGYVHAFTFDSIGALIRDDDPAGGFQVLSRTGDDTSYTVTRTTAMGRTWTYFFGRTATRDQRKVVTGPSGFATRTIHGASGTTQTTTPDSTVLSVTTGGDPRWGMLAPIASQTTLTTPGGLTSTIVRATHATLSDSTVPFSLVTFTDSLVLNGNATVTAFDPAQRGFTTTTPEGRQTFTRIDSVGRVLSERPLGLDSVTYAYDGQGRLSQTVSGGRTWQYDYDTSGRLLSTLDPLARQDSLFYDSADRVTRSVLPGGREMLFDYDSSGNLTAVTPPQNPLHAFTYTPVDLVSQYDPPNVGLTTPATTFSYNLDRQITRITRPDSLTIDLGYDAAGRLDTVTFDRGQIAYNYSPTTGQLVGITAPGNNTISLTQDGLLPTGITWAGDVQGSVGVTYDSDLRVSGLTVNGANNVAFAYDLDGLLTGAGSLGIQRSPLNGLPERDSIGAVVGSWSFDSRSALAGYTSSTPGGNVYQTSYTRDSLARITQITETVQGTTVTIGYTYDPAGRLYEVRRDGLLVATYEHDDNGNRTRLTTPSGVVIGAYDAQDRLTQYDTTSYSYTANGELNTEIAGTDTTSYLYDAFGNLVSVTLPNGTVITYVIDGRNRRIGKRVDGIPVQGFLYQNQIKPIAELDGTTQVVSRFVYGDKPHVPDYMVKGGASYRIVTDHLGSVRLVVDAATGQVAQRMDYDEFGRVTVNTSPGFQPFGFAGGIYDEQTRLLRFGARDYDPVVGRWTAKDPVRFVGGDPNLYAYVWGDPVNLTDPSGLCPKDIQDCIERNKFSSLFDDTPLDRVAEVLEIAGPLSLAGDVLAGAAKSKRVGAGAPKNPYASGINWVGRRIADLVGSPKLKGVLVRVGDKVTLPLAFVGAFTAGYNLSIEVQCLLGFL